MHLSLSKAGAMTNSKKKNLQSENITTDINILIVQLLVPS